MHTIQNRKTSAFAYVPLINPPPSLSKITCKYNSMLTYIPVSFVFFQKKDWVSPVRVKNRVRVKVSFRVRVRDR